MREINIEKIMEEIRAEIKDKYGDEAISFASVKKEEFSESVFDLEGFRQVLHQANMSYEMNYYFPLPGGIKGFVKRTVRKFGAFLGLPLTQAQTDYNARTVRMFNELNNYIDYQDAKTKELERLIENLEEKIARMEQNEAKK